MDHKLNMNQQCNIASKKVNAVLGGIKGTMSESTESLFLSRLCWSDCIYKIVFGSVFKMDIDKLKHIQRRTIKMISSVERKMYEEQLESLHIFSSLALVYQS